jgi:hypothetical protein
VDSVAVFQPVDSVEASQLVDSAAVMEVLYHWAAAMVVWLLMVVSEVDLEVDSEVDSVAGFQVFVL